MLQLCREWEAISADSPEETAIRRSLNNRQLNFTRKVETFLRKQKKYSLKQESRDTKELEQNSMDKLANETKLEDTSNEEDNFDAIPARSKSSKSFRTPAKRANCKSAKSKTKGIRNTGDCIMKKKWTISSSIFKTKKIGEIRKLIFAKRKISEPIEPFDNDDEDIEPIGGGKPSAPKKSKKEKTKTSVVINISSSPSKSFDTLNTIPKLSVVPLMKH
ncbi:hypothetical protein OCU04_007649 [Sclerotinia nivalis]|uniref:Uncharacterized protein n=1 Tax=Sclerotinia nivalis TaxID=352851 RepID=A0A9X0AK67_9HELO|nr:hypothetical protein OCU04_007649 [Sclerotinia nivalis]